MTRRHHTKWYTSIFMSRKRGTAEGLIPNGSILVTVDNRVTILLLAVAPTNHTVLPRSIGSFEREMLWTGVVPSRLGSYLMIEKLCTEWINRTYDTPK